MLTRLFHGKRQDEADAPRPFLEDRAYLASTASHFSIDVLNNGRILIIALLAVSLGLSNAQVGLLLLLYNLGGSLSQPFFGWLADRSGARLISLGGLAWVILFYALASMLPDWPALAALTVASLGSGAFHPGGTKVASQSSDAKRTQATALFFMAGQFGLFVGPIAAGFILDAYGRPGYIILPLLATTVLAAGWRWLKDDVHDHGRPMAPGRRRAAPPHFWATVIAIIAISFAYNTVSFSSQNFAPKLFTEWGYSARYVGWAAGLYMMGSAVGGLVGGIVADRIGGRPVIFLSMLLTIPFIFTYIPAGDPWRFPLLLFAGFFGGMPHSILILRAQSLLPGRRALASGLALGFMFLAGSVGAYLVGVAADAVGLALTLQALAFLPLLAVAASLLLPRWGAQPVTAQPAN